MPSIYYRLDYSQYCLLPLKVSHQESLTCCRSKTCIMSVYNGAGGGGRGLQFKMTIEVQRQQYIGSLVADVQQKSIKPTV